MVASSALFRNLTSDAGRGGRTGLVRARVHLGVGVHRRAVVAGAARLGGIDRHREDRGGCSETQVQGPGADETR